ncbi:MAG: SPOR domain-containing protein [Phycisphaerales bacterium]
MNRTCSSPARSLGTALLLTGVCTLWACNKQADTNEPFIAEYRSGDYGQAYREAEAQAQNSEGEAKDRASLMAGLAAYADRRPDTAERWLTPLAANANPEISGTAGWTLGLIALDRGSNAKAASLLPPAAEKLRGDDAAKANIAAGDAFSRLGRAPQAREAYQAAVNAATIESTRGDARQRLTNAGTGSATPTGQVVGSSLAPPLPQPVVVSRGFTGNAYIIQLAAVGDPGKAASLANSAAPAAQKAGQPRPIVAATTDRKSGRTLYGVQIGPFPSRPAAEAALRQTGLAGTVMAAAR